LDVAPNGQQRSGENQVCNQRDAYRDGNQHPIVALMELAPEFDVNLVDLSTVRLMGAVTADLAVDPVGDFNENGIADLRFEFDRDEVEAVLTQDGDVLLVVTGILEGITSFMGLGPARVILPFVLEPNGGEVLRSGASTEVSWQNPEGWPVDYVDLSLSADGGTSWDPLAANLRGTSATVELPAVESEQMLVRVHYFDGERELGHDSSDAFFTLSASVTAVEGGPAVFGLIGNAPNPFSRSTVVRFGLSRPGRATLRIFDLRGRLVRTLVDEVLAAGRHEVAWSGRDDTGSAVASGVYFYRLQAEGQTAIRRLTLQQ